MKVKELIVELLDYDVEAEVVCTTYKGDYKKEIRVYDEEKEDGTKFIVVYGKY